MTQSRRLAGALAIACAAAFCLSAAASPDGAAPGTDKSEPAIAAIESQLAQLRALPAPRNDREEAHTEKLLKEVEAGLGALKESVTAQKQQNEIERLALELEAVTQPKIELFRANYSVSAAPGDVEFGIKDPAGDDEREREESKAYVPGDEDPRGNTTDIPQDDYEEDEAAAAPAGAAQASDVNINVDVNVDEGTGEVTAEEADVPTEDATDAEEGGGAVTEAGATEGETSEAGEEGAVPAEGAGPAEEGAVPPGEPGALEPPMPRDFPSAQTGDSNTAISSKIISLEATDETALAAEGVSPADAPAPVAGSDAPPAPPTEYKGDPLARRVNLDFREMELSNVVALLGHMAGINVVAGTDITGSVTANMQDVPLRQAMETVLRMNNLGMVEEEGIFLIVPYEEAVSAKQTTSMIKLQNAKARDVEQVLADLMKNSRDQRLLKVSSNERANMLVISGPEKRVADLLMLAQQLDIAEPALPRVTEPIKLNYAEPSEIVEMIEKMLTPKIGQVAVDERSRHIIVTDEPIVVEQVRALVQQLDLPVKQVAIDAMVVDVNLEDDASTGVDWLLNAVRRQSRRDEAAGTGDAVGNLENLGLDTNLGIGNPAGALAFEILSSDINWSGIVQAEVRNFNGELVSNPVLVTVENKPATIEIVREIPFVELTQTDRGGSQTSTEFKIVGTVLSVIPRVTHNNDIIVDLEAKESDTSGEFNGVPIEDKRQLQTTLLLKNGQTVFTGGLRKNNKDNTVRKIPVLGDVPVVNFLFRQNTRTDEVSELLIFLTCRVVEHDQGLTPYQAQKVEAGESFDLKVDEWNELANDTVYPNAMRDPMWKWRRSE